MDANGLAALASLILEHKWLGVSVIVVGALVRYSKGDLPMPSWMATAFLKIPSKARPALSLSLGVLSGCLDALASGKAWKIAIKDGIVTGALPILGHYLLVDVARDGRDVLKKKEDSLCQSGTQTEAQYVILQCRMNG